MNTNEKSEKTLKQTKSIVHNRYRKDIKLGEGTYGEVFKATDIVKGCTVAIKKVKIFDTDHKSVNPSDPTEINSTTLREIAVMKDLAHPNLLRLNDVIYSYDNIYLIFDYCEIDLHRLLKNNPQTLPLDFIKRTSFQLLDALAYMHSHRILHRDIKPSNVLLNGDTVKLADFGLARSIGIPIKAYTVEVVTMWYRPPELIEKSQVYSSSIDIWGIGAVIAEMVIHEPLFRGDSDIDQLHKIFNILGLPNEKELQDLTYFKNDSIFSYEVKQEDNILERLRTMGESGFDLLLKMFNYNPGKRISARESLKHPFFQPQCTK